MPKRGSDADRRVFFDQLVSVGVSRLRAMGAIRLEDRQALIPFGEQNKHGRLARQLKPATASPSPQESAPARVRRLSFAGFGKVASRWPRHAAGFSPARNRSAFAAFKTRSMRPRTREAVSGLVCQIGVRQSSTPAVSTRSIRDSQIGLQ
jgi:hypothetical protein